MVSSTILPRIARRKSIIKRRAARRKSTNKHITVESDAVSSESSEAEYSSYEEDLYSEVSIIEKGNNEVVNTDLNTFSWFCNKLLLFIPIFISLAIRSLGDKKFFAIALAWAVILPFTSDISLEEIVFPSLLAVSLGYDNGVVRRNMYISLARSRLGFAVLVLLSVYSLDFHILGCAILQRMLVSFTSHVLQNSIPISETTLLCGAIVNMIYHCIRDAFFDINISDPVCIILSGLGAALPCYPLFTKFVSLYRKKHGYFCQWPWAIAIYAVYFSSAVYLYFFMFGVKFTDLYNQLMGNLDLIVYWFCILVNAFFIAVHFGSRLTLDGRRKLWHICTVLMFIPGWVRERTFTKLALAVVLVLFIALETERATALPPFGVHIHRSLQQFIDHRDKRGPVIISHLYLLIGISVPIFLAQSPAGVICLGLGDTFASQIGRKYGRLRVFGHKSLEGTLAFTVVAVIALVLTDSTSSFSSYKTWLIAFSTALIEAVTPINDNIVVPAYMMSVQGLLA